MQIADIDFCGPGDFEEIFAVESACFDMPWPRHVIRYDLDNMGELVYMKAVLKDFIAGYGVLGRGEGVSHLLNLAVLPEFRRSGIASQLMLALEEIALIWGSRRMRLEVRSSNALARDFYARFGFVYKTRAKNYYANGEDALIMVARLPLAQT